MRVERLQIFDKSKRVVDISFDVTHSLALVGQSGSGKSLTLKALLNLAPKNLHVDMQIRSDFALIGGESVAFVPQNPFTALSPLTKIKDQFFAPLEKIEPLFSLLKLDRTLLKRYPPELSGGQLQRVVIAMALSFSPKLLLLDEPTTALDATTTEHILELIADIQTKLGFKLIFVTHDMYAAKKLCREIAVIKEGAIVEDGMMDEVYHHPKEAYTKLLIDSNFATREFRL